MPDLDLFSAPASEKGEACPACEGKGWTAEHNPDANAYDDEGKCNPGYCPIQVQCEACNGTGRKSATAQPAASEEIGALLDSLSREVAMMGDIWVGVECKCDPEVGYTCEACAIIGARHHADRAIAALRSRLAKEGK